MVTWMLVSSFVGCAPDCPVGKRADTARVERLARHVGHDVTRQVCFGEVGDRGVVDEAGRFLLDAALDDRAAAARVLHLELHTATPTGADCRAVLVHEEAVAWSVELEARVRLGVVDATCPATAALGPSPTVPALRHWFSTSNTPVPAALRASHDRRCE